MERNEAIRGTDVIYLRIELLNVTIHLIDCSMRQLSVKHGVKPRRCQGFRLLRQHCSCLRGGCNRVEINQINKSIKSCPHSLAACHCLLFRSERTNRNTLMPIWDTCGNNIVPGTPRELLRACIDVGVLVSSVCASFAIKTGSIIPSCKRPLVRDRLDHSPLGRLSNNLHRL
jgi:hypothetical protein